MTTATKRRARSSLPCHGQQVTFHLPEHLADGTHSEDFRCTRCGAGWLGVVVEADGNELRAAFRQMDEGLDGYVGLISRRRSRDTGTVVGLYAALPAGMENDPETPWAIVCEDHSRLVCCGTYTQAREQASAPLGWCEVCAGTDTEDDG